MKKLIIICLTLLSSIGFAQPFSATNQVIVNSTNNPPAWGRGFDFTPNVTIYLTQMGKRVPSVATYTWNIWQVNTQTLIHSQTSTSTTPGVYTYENISAPVTLFAGVEYCLTLYGDGNAGAQYYFDPSSQINSNLTYNFMRYCNSCTSGVFPTSVLTNYHYGTPDFMFTTAPPCASLNCGTGAEGAFLASSNTTLAGGIHNFTSFTINAGVTVNVTGSAPLDIRCTGAVNIQGTLAANGGNGGNGVTFSTFGTGGIGVAGGANGGNGSYSNSTGPLPGIAGSGTGGGGAGDGWSGGGGAGYAAAGANSGGVGGFGGNAYGNPQISPVVAGSGGGGGSGGFSCGSGGGGAGGGVISISACGSFTIGAAGAIRSNGGNGGSDGTGNCGGGGGGSGGSILLAAANINNSGTISAVAGTGGASAVPGSPYFGTGAAGSAGRIRMDYNTFSGGGTVTPAGFVSSLNSSVTPTITGNTSFCSGSSTTLDAGSGYSLYNWSTGATTQTINVNTANTFTVTVTDGNGCTGSASATTTVNANPTPAITGSLSFCAGSSTILNAGVFSGYNWSTGATTQTISVSTAGTFTVTVTNANGCTGSTSATTTVIPLPTISTTGPLNLNNTPGFCSATVSNAQLMAQVTSVTGTPPPTVTFSPPAGTFPVGTTLVTATATNTCGAPTSSFNVVVTDNENPTIACPPAVTVNTNPGLCYATGVVLGSPSYGDNCTGSTIGNNAPAQFPQGGTYVQWEVTDQSGNKANCQQLVTVIDNQPPVALCKNICIYLGSNGLATITGADIDNGSYDNCALDPGPNGLVASQTSFSYADAGPNTVTLTVKDINGNTSTCTATVTVGEYYTLFGAGPTCSTPTGQPDNCHVNIGNGNTVSGNVGSYRLITTGGGVVINGNVISGGKVNYANGVSSKSVSAANLLGQSGLIFQTGNSADITGDVNVTGNININQNAGSFVTGIVRHPVGTTYAGPVPGGGVLLAPAIIPVLPGMPTINAYSCGGANITTTATLIPGSYGNLILGNASGVIITFSGPGNYYFSSIKMGQGGIHTFKYDFLGLPGKINIYVCGDIDFGTHMSQWANPNTSDACRVYFETHGTGSTNGTNSVQAAVIALGSQFYGRIWAPYGGIKIGSGSCCTYATGSFWSAKQVQLEGAVTISRCGSTCPPGPRIGQEGTTAEDMKDMLQVYPNPTTGQITVSFFTETPDNFSLKVLDYQGRVVLSNQIKSIAGDNTLEVDMSQFAKGLYMIEVGNADHSQKVKLVVQ